LISATSYVVPALIGLAGALIGGSITGGVTVYVARKTRQAAEQEWIRDSRRDGGVLPPKRFTTVAECVRSARHQTIDAMRKALELEGEARPPKGYNPFTDLDHSPESDRIELEEQWTASERDRPGSDDARGVG
jgi:hypothetical protein